MTREKLAEMERRGAEFLAKPKKEKSPKSKMPYSTSNRPRWAKYTARVISGLATTSIAVGKGVLDLKNEVQHQRRIRAGRMALAMEENAEMDERLMIEG